MIGKTRLVIILNTIIIQLAFSVCFHLFVRRRRNISHNTSSTVGDTAQVEKRTVTAKLIEEEEAEVGKVEHAYTVMPFMF